MSNITETDIPDKQFKSIDEQAEKILFVDELIADFAPLFYEELRTKQRQLDINLNDLKKLKKIVDDNREKIILIVESKKLELYKQKITEKVKILLSIDVLYGKSKIVVIDILKSLNDKDVEALKRDLQRLNKLINNKK